MENAERVFLTGASGFVASHILSELIEAGYLVTASVRTPAKGREILNLHPAWEPNITFVYIPDIAAEGAYKDVFESNVDKFDYIVHTASPVTFSPSDIQRDILDPAVQGTIGLLHQTKKSEGSRLKRFVLLGSAVAVLNSFEDESVAGKAYTEADWNPVTAAQAIEANDAVLGYNASKKLAEKAAWDFMEEHKPGFELTVINPDIIIGPMLQPVKSPKAVNETNMFAIYNFLNGKYTQIDGLKFPFYHFVDVRDVARAHVLALTNPAAANKRILLISGEITPQLVVNIIRKNFPELRNRAYEGEPDQIYPKGVKPTGWDTSRSYEIFGSSWGYIGLEKSIVDTVNSILQLEKGWKM
ncbi:MAG: hypothetical protein M1834_007788 [Cirrosporium novae-zelandiae]|nr:MAG: hypothetical protein M1834_007788 [Cirrosporium novae-zelandiae]